MIRSLQWGVFIDLKRAFDTIDHDILLKKMERFGIRGVGLEWLKNYIRNRTSRCPFVQEKCRHEKPALGDNGAACFYPLK